jgi:transcriptional regulator with XRE-family HTH domain
MSEHNREGRKEITNRLWLARKRRGIDQRQAAHLLNHRSIDQVSRYEQGTRLPSLENALKLEIIYGVPLRLLFKGLYDRLEDEVWRRISLDSKLQKIYGNRPAGGAGLSDYCAFDELLSTPNSSEADLAKSRRHVTALARKIAGL